MAAELKKRVAALLAQPYWNRFRLADVISESKTGKKFSNSNLNDWRNDKCLLR